MNNLYREAFIFDRLWKYEEIYIFNDGKMKLHFIDILDVCQFIHTLIQLQSSNFIYRIAHEVVSVKEWIEKCEKIVGQKARLDNVDYHLLQLNSKSFLPFRDYEYILDTTCQDKIYQCLVFLEEGLQKGYDFYLKYDGITEEKNKYMFLKDKHLKSECLIQ